MLKEYHSFYFITYLTRKRSRKMPRLSFLHSDQILPVQSELGMFSLLYLLSVVETGWMFGFVSTWVSTRALGGLCCVASLSRGRFVLFRLLSCGDLKLLRDFTGKAVSEAV